MKKVASNIAGLFVILTITFSCLNKTDENNSEIKHGTGTLWLSGGLYFCATQIRMESGDTIIPINIEQVLVYKSGQRLKISYKELENKESGCSIGKDCYIEKVVAIE